jgi:hypothetical protein
MWTYRDAGEGGAVPDTEYIMAWNRTGATRTRGYVAVLNDNGTNTTYDDADGSDTDAERNVIAMTATDVECRAVVLADERATADKWCRWCIRGKCQAMVASQAGDATAVPMNSPITLSSHITNVSTVSAGQFTSRNRTGSGSLDAVTVDIKVFGVTRESTTNTAALKWIYLDGNGYRAGHG